MAKNTCNNCQRTVVLVRIDGNLVATDPELIMVVPARQKIPSSAAMERGTREMPGIEMVPRQTFARRLHAEQCQSYQDAARRERIAAEQREYNRQHGHTPRKNRGL